MLNVAIILLAYLLGSIPSGLVAGRVVGRIDIRKHGSGNPGVTNVFRILGWKPALAVAAVDILKGYVAARYLGTLGGGLSDIMPIAAGTAAVMGHTYSVFARFRGGKGIATLAGMFIALYPWAVPVCLGVFILALVITGYVSVASMGAAVTLPLVVFVIPELGFQEVGLALKVLALIVPAFVLYTHRTNIGRLLDGSENRFEKARIFRNKSPD